MIEINAQNGTINSRERNLNNGSNSTAENSVRFNSTQVEANAGHIEDKSIDEVLQDLTTLNSNEGTDKTLIRNARDDDLWNKMRSSVSISLGAIGGTAVGAYGAATTGRHFSNYGNTGRGAAVPEGKRSLPSEQEVNSEITNLVSAEAEQGEALVREKRNIWVCCIWRGNTCIHVDCSWGRKKRSLPSELESNSRTTWPLLNSNSYNNPTNLLISSSNQNLSTSSINSFATSQNLSLLYCIANSTDTSSSKAYQTLRSQGVNFVPSTNETVNYGMRKFDLFVNEQIKTLSSKEEQNRIRLELKAARPDIRMSLARGVEFSGNKGLDDVLAKSKDCFVSTYMSSIIVSALNRGVTRN